jgi:hypothetical protein
MRRWLVGVVGLGAELHQRPHAARVALQFEWRRKTRGAQVPRPSGAAPEGLAGMAELRRACSREDAQGGKIRFFATTHKPCQMCKKKPIAAHVVRW